MTFMSQGVSFDYNAPAELFLAKPAKGCRTKYRRFATTAEALRFAGEDLRMPKAFGAWLEVGDERSVAKSNASMKPKTIRCGSLSDRRPNAPKPVATMTDGSSHRGKLRIFVPQPGLQKSPVKPPTP